MSVRQAGCECEIWAHCDCECAGGPALFLRHQLEAPDGGQLQPVLQSLHGELSAALWWRHRSVGVSYRYRFIFLTGIGLSAPPPL